ncbi:GNAT family N-acetyltransferase [Neobacillus niacini]|uniref:GNAT family N-acetyltransferase n=1 Tax=Neobacillus niacini TaxID=86668 RepID=UPI0037C6DA13
MVSHTIVYKGHNGKGLGKKLVDRMAEYAREENNILFQYVPMQKVSFKARKNIMLF